MHVLATQLLLDHDLAGREGLAQDLDGRSRIGSPAHEDIERGVSVFRPAMDRDVRLGKHRDPGYAPVRREVVEMNVQKRRACDLHTTSERLLDVLYLIEPLCPNEIDNEMRARKADSVTLTEKVLVPLSFGESAPGKLFFRLGGA
jgi:hypothetical protein